MIFQWMCPIITIHNDCLQVIKEDDDRYDDIVSTRCYYGKFRDNHLAFSHRVCRIPTNFGFCQLGGMQLTKLPSHPSFILPLQYELNHAT